MKLAVLLLTLAISCGSVTRGNAKEAAETRNEELLERAASQLERLSTFRRTRQSLPKVVQIVPNTDEKASRTIEQTQTPDDIIEARKRIDDLRASAAEILRDPQYEAIMQDRIKRSFISGIANKLIGGVTSASGSLSRGSSGLSGSGPPSGYGYGYGHSYESDFNIWDFKKAIINTLIQAIKAIGGGAIAGGGALIKGGGYLVSAKGRVISSAGDAITSLGKSLASSAIIAGPKPVYGAPAYSYPHPPTHTSQDINYDGPPPSADAYAGPEDGYNSNYASPTNDDGPDEQAGVLIVKETKPGNEHDDIHEIPTSSVHHQTENLPSLEESFGGSSKIPSSTVTKIVGFLNSGKPTLNTHQTQEEHVHYYSDNKDQPPSSHPPLDLGYLTDSHQHHPESSHSNDYQDYQANGQIYDSYGTKLEPSSPQLSGAHAESHHSNDGHQYNNDQSLKYQQIQSLLNTHLEVPKSQEPTTFKDPTSYADYANHYQSEPLKIPIIDHQQNSLDQGVGGSFNYYGMPSYGNGAATGHAMIGLHGDISNLPMIPNYNYPLQTGMGFGHHLQHPSAGGPTVLGVWGRMSRRTSGLGKKTSKSNKGLEIQRSIGYSLKNAKLTRI